VCVLVCACPPRLNILLRATCHHVGNSMCRTRQNTVDCYRINTPSSSPCSDARLLLCLSRMAAPRRASAASVGRLAVKARQAHRDALVLQVTECGLSLDAPRRRALARRRRAPTGSDQSNEFKGREGRECHGGVSSSPYGGCVPHDTPSPLSP